MTPGSDGGQSAATYAEIWEVVVGIRTARKNAIVLLNYQPKIYRRKTSPECSLNARCIRRGPVQEDGGVEWRCLAAAVIQSDHWQQKGWEVAVSTP